MKTTIYCAAVAAAFLALCGCSPKQKDAPSINASMRGVMEPEAEKIWDTASKAYNDMGDALVPQKIGDADWKVVAEASQKLKDRAEYLENAEHLTVAEANEPILGSQDVGEKGSKGPAWDPVGAPTVQGRVDAQPDLFKQKAHMLVESADAMHRAARNKDAALLYKVMSNLDEVCDGCHEPFWGTDEPPSPHS